MQGTKGVSYANDQTRIPRPWLAYVSELGPGALCLHADFRADARRIHRQPLRPKHFTKFAARAIWRALFF